MRVSIYINEETDAKVIERIRELKSNGDNVSRFFVNAVKEALEGDKKDLRQTVREIIEQELKMENSDTTEPRNHTMNIEDKLKRIYD